MTLIEEIQADTINSQSDLGTILRKCKLLAARLDSKPLEDWLLWESNGYPNHVQVPDYRIWQLQLKGHFAGPFGSGLNNAPVPLVCLPEDVRMSYEEYKCRQSIAALESLLKTGGHSFRVDTGDLNVALGMNVYKRMNCLQVWAESGAAHFVEVINSVRNRILDFSLAIWKEYPSAGEVNAQNRSVIEPSHVTQIFHTTVYDGGSATLVGSVGVLRGDLSSLRNSLERDGIRSEDIDSLSVALKADEPPVSKEKFGPKVTTWLGQMALKATEGTLKTAGTVALKAATDAIMHYYGLSK